MFVSIWSALRGAPHRTHARILVRSGRMQQMKLEHEVAEKERNFTSEKQLRERHTNTAETQKELDAKIELTLRLSIVEIDEETTQIYTHLRLFAQQFF